MRTKLPLALVAISCVASAGGKPHPTVAAIAYNCSHSDQPFSDGHESESIAIDLASATRTADSTTVPAGDDRRAPGTPSKATHTHVVTKLDAKRVAALRTAANAVVAGGPFQPEYPVPEGTSCSLQLLDGSNGAIFSLEKSDPHIDDAATRLIAMLRSSG